MKTILVKSVPCASLAFLLAGACLAAAQPPAKSPTRLVVFKRVGDVELKLHVFEPQGHRPSDRRAAIVFFFGGGWNGGSPSQFYPQAEYLASRGMLAMAAEYRVRRVHGVSPFVCVQDGKSAMRWIRRQAESLGVDPHRIAAGGGSAGGHVAAATATVPGLDEDGEDRSVSCVPDALVLFNPVYDNGPQGYGYDRVKDRHLEISPLHNIRGGAPPNIVFFGDKDSLVPVATAKAFQAKMKKVGTRSELMLFPHQPHGFFNAGRGGGHAYRQTVHAMDRFLQSLGYLQGEPTIDGSGQPPLLK
jgi:acetyl esterase/lipase